MKVSHPDASVQIWAEDEHRLGLLPVIRRVWAPRGQRPSAHVRRRYEWLYVYAFVRPTTGESWWCLLPTVSTEAMTLAFASFAAETGINAQHRVVLMVDGAGWHTSGTLVVPDGLHLIQMPPASPELQPVERIWPLVDEPVANRTFADLDALETVLVARCRTLRADRRTIKAHTRYHWWPHERRPRKPT